MPSFAGRLSARQIEDVAAFVSRSARPRATVTAKPFRPDTTVLGRCFDDFACYEQAFGNIAFGEGPKAALDRLERTIQTDARVEADCHRIAHVIGAAALARFKGSVAKAFVEGSSVCASGYYHGLLERAFLGLPDTRLGPTARGLCSDAAIRRIVFTAYQCVHGLGHGLMIYTGYDLPLSLRTCHALATGWDRTSCTGGVFMENFVPSYGARSPWLKPGDPIYPCNAVARRDKLYCYLLVTSSVLVRNGYDWAKTVDACRSVERAWIATCFQSLGRDASGSTRQDPRRAGEICALAAGLAGECLYGAARDMANTYANGERAAQLCARAPVSFRWYCFYGIGTILGTLKPTAELRAAACRSTTREYFEACRNGASDVSQPAR